MPVKVVWQAEDGYCGGARPHIISIPDEEFEDCETEEERTRVIEDWVQSDFEQTVSWSYKIAD